MVDRRNLIWGSAAESRPTDDATRHPYWFVVVGVAAAVLCGRWPSAAFADDPIAAGPARVAWTSSRLIGSPEPPLEYTVEQTFTQLALRTPVYLVEEPGSNYLLVVLASADAQQPSQIVRFQNDPQADSSELYFELPGRLLYSLVFHPDHQRNGHAYLFSNGPLGDSERTNRVSRFTVSPDSHRLDPDSELVVLEWRSMGHDGGDLVFGLDGMLYITTGDGTSDSDPWDAGQSLDDLLGSVLRIDVDHSRDGLPYSIPSDNPFVQTPGARGEIWAYGLRNPWRMSFDRPSGQLWVGNNGQDLWESAHLVERGENYGWSVYEGSHPFYLGRKRGPTPLVPPTIEHHHCDFRSLTGGVVYRGQKFPELDGAYIYGDYSSGRIWGMKHDGRRAIWHRELADTQLAIAAFQISRQGDLFVVDHGGGIYQLATAPVVEVSAPFPRRLSETGLFASVTEQQAAAGVIPYSVNVPGWHDGARADRWMAVPGEQRVGYDSGRSWTFPDGTALVQTLSLGAADGGALLAASHPARTRIETRVLLRQQGEWTGYSYRWNDAQDDAELVPAKGADVAFTFERGAKGEPLERIWRFPSRSECLACHSRAANFVLGLTEAQLNRDPADGRGGDNQLHALAQMGLFTAPLPKPVSELSRLSDPGDPSQDLEARARAYLHVNCSVCHVSAGGGNARLELSLATPRDGMQLIGARPQHDTFGLENAMLVAPGAPDRSVLVSRLSRRGAGQMPPLGSHAIDESAVALMREWISQLQPQRSFVRNWTLDDLAPSLEQQPTEQALAAGRTIYREIGCADCHRLAGEGGTVGPDLSGMAKRYSRRALLESILNPSQSVADEYAVTLIATERGHIHSGRIEREDDAVVVLRPSAADELPVEIPLSEIVERQKSDRSSMPAGTLNGLQPEEIVDLLEYLLQAEAGPDPRFN